MTPPVRNPIYDEIEDSVIEALEDNAKLPNPFILKLDVAHFIAMLRYGMSSNDGQGVPAPVEGTHELWIKIADYNILLQKNLEVSVQPH